MVKGALAKVIEIRTQLIVSKLLNIIQCSYLTIIISWSAPYIEVVHYNCVLLGKMYLYNLVPCLLL